MAFDLILSEESIKNGQKKKNPMCECSCYDNVKSLQNDFEKLKRDIANTVSVGSDQNINGSGASSIKSDLLHLENTLLDRLHKQDEVIAEQSDKIQQLNKIVTNNKLRFYRLIRYINRERKSVVDADHNYSRARSHQGGLTPKQASKESECNTALAPPTYENVLDENYIPYNFELTITTTSTKGNNPRDQAHSTHPSGNDQWILAGKTKKASSSKSYKEEVKQNLDANKECSTSTQDTSAKKVKSAEVNGNVNYKVKQLPNNHPSASKEPRKNINTQRKAVLIYDNHFHNFKNDFFSRNFDVETIKLKTASDSSTLIKEAKNRKKLNGCEVVFVHVGSKDIELNKGTLPTMDAIKSLVLQILKNSSAQVCVSTPIRRSAPKKDEELAAIEANLYDLCSEFKGYSKRISIAKLYSIGTFLATNSEGKHTLTPRGESRLFLKLKDYMFTALGYSLHKEKSYYRKMLNDE